MITKEADVSHTRIFARVDGDEQVIVYQAELFMFEPAAMVLPIPESTSADDAVEFINLEEHEGLFSTLKYRFASQQTMGMRGVKSFAFDGLKVEDVGAFEGSYVPSQADFKRLDKRFRLKPEIWDMLPQYEDYGFVVFQFKTGNHDPHPMAFRFKTRHPDAIFLPTVHVHDEQMHEEGDFDHVLYVQTPGGNAGLATTLNELEGVPLLDEWEADVEESREKALEQFADTGLFNTDPMWRLEIKGKRPNKDFWVKL